MPFFPCVLSLFFGQASEVPESPSSPTNLYNFPSLEICVPQRTIERELCLKDPLFILNAHFGKTFSPLLLIDGNVRNIRLWYTLWRAADSCRAASLLALASSVPPSWRDCHSALYVSLKRRPFHATKKLCSLKEKNDNMLIFPHKATRIERKVEWWQKRQRTFLCSLTGCCELRESNLYI